MKYTAGLVCLGLMGHDTVYCALPLYHAMGFATLNTSILMGKLVHSGVIKGSRGACLTVSLPISHLVIPSVFLSLTNCNNPLKQ